jgi:L-lactate dehydrogenase complex protein LldG
MSTLESFLQSIRTNLPKEKVNYPLIPSFESGPEDLMQEFQANLLKAEGAFFRPSSIAEAQKIVKETHPGAKVICSAADEWKGTKDIRQVKQPKEMADVDLAIVRSTMAVAETGMVWLTEADLMISSLGYLCQHIIVLLDPKRITRNMHTAYRQVQLDKNNYGCFVMGPSATADIGAVLIHGAQGPRSLTVMLLEEPANKTA